MRDQRLGVRAVDGVEDLVHRHREQVELVDEDHEAGLPPVDRTAVGERASVDEGLTRVGEALAAWRRDWEKARQRPLDAKQSRGEAESLHYGTVGCVALDMQGNLAAGTSTGGITNKKFGRVGDSPIIGAGTYADNATCAISATGIGEQFIRNSVAHDISARVAYLQQPLKEAVQEVLHKTLRVGDGGLIALDALGSIVMDFSTGGMARAAADSRGYREVRIGR